MHIATDVSAVTLWTCRDVGASKAGGGENDDLISAADEMLMSPAILRTTVVYIQVEDVVDEDLDPVCPGHWKD